MNERLPVSVVIPVRNEEQNLLTCLSRLDRFSEILVVDSHSTDATCDIAISRGAEVIQFEWDGRYPKKRNWVLLNHVFKNQWVLFLDADEWVTDEFCDQVAQALKIDRHNGFWLHYTNYFLDKPLRHGDPQRKLALFRLGSGLYERINEEAWSSLDMEIHEHPIIDGAVGEIKARIEHRDGRGVAKFVQRHVEYALWEACRTATLQKGKNDIWDGLTSRQRAKYTNVAKWWFAPSYFFWTYVAKRGFLDGTAGLSYALLKLWYFWTIRLLIREHRSKPDD